MFTINQAGEAESYLAYEHVIYADDLPGHDNAGLFSAQIHDPNAAPEQPIVFTAAQATRFMADNTYHLRYICNMPEAQLPTEQLAEMCYIRYQMVRNKLAAARTTLVDYHCTINNVAVYDAGGAAIPIWRATPQYGQLQNAVMNEINNHNDNYSKIRENFATIVYCVAKIFQAKGHHFITDTTDEEDYQHLFKKALRGQRVMHSPWKYIATMGLHAILPAVLDAFWIRCAHHKTIPEALIVRLNVAAAGTAVLDAFWIRCAHHKTIPEALIVHLNVAAAGTAVLDAFWIRCAHHKTIPEALTVHLNVAAAGTAVLDAFWIRCAHHKTIPEALIVHLNVAAAGTAAVLALQKGWLDARTCYASLLSGYESTYQDLLAIADHIRKNRWDYGINAKYYGAHTEHLDLSQMCAMAATIQGVYEATALNATLLGSKSMDREALKAPIQKDMALASACHLPKLLVKSLQTEVERGHIRMFRT